MDYVSYIHSDNSISTVGEFVNSQNSVAKQYIGDLVGLLDYKGGSGRSNLARVYDNYTLLEKSEANTDIFAENYDIPLKQNTELLIPKDKVNQEVLAIRGKNLFVKQNNFKTFVADELYKLISDPLYIKNRDVQTGDTKQIFPNLTVWIWVRALDQVLNITNFVNVANTQKSSQNGSFSLTVTASNIGSSNTGTATGNINVEHLLDSDGKLNTFFLHNKINTQDVVFIKFEKLQIEKDEIKDFFIPKSKLAGQIYDMVGLVDSNAINGVFANNEVTIELSGRDLTKLIIEDASYFMPLLFVEDSNDLFINFSSDNDKLLKRNFTNGKYEVEFAYSLRSIRDTLSFIINQLVNIGVVPNDLFNAYGDRRTETYRTSNDDETFKAEPATGIWQIIKLVIDKNVEDRRIADPSVSQPDGALISQFNKICQMPFVEFLTDTYGDLFHFIVRQPPFTKDAIRGYLNNAVEVESTAIPTGQKDLVIDIETIDTLNLSVNFDESNVFTWFEIKPQGAFLGDASNVALAYVPVVYFPQYADIWGSRKMSVVTNYISKRAFTGITGNENRDLFKEAVINDLKLLIDNYSYMPFTRQGTITINRDRRIKVGMWIRLKLTGEIYYVNSVSHTYSQGNVIDATTSLSVSRGMVEDYVKGKGGISYFDIVNTDLIAQSLIERLTSPTSTGETKETVKNKRSIKTNFGVNEEVFNFFLERKQFDNEQIQTESRNKMVDFDKYISKKRTSLNK